MKYEIQSNYTSLNRACDTFSDKDCASMTLERLLFQEPHIKSYRAIDEEGTFYSFQHTNNNYYYAEIVAQEN